MKTVQLLLTAWLLVLPVLGLYPNGKRQPELVVSSSFKSEAEGPPESGSGGNSGNGRSSGNGSNGGNGGNGGNSGSGGNGNGNNGNGGNSGNNGNNNGNNNNNNGNNSKGGKKGVQSPASQSKSQSKTESQPTSSTTTSTILSTTTVEMFTPSPTTTTNTIEISSFISSASAAAGIAPSSSAETTSATPRSSSLSSTEATSSDPTASGPVSGSNPTITTTPTFAPTAIGSHTTNSLDLPSVPTSGTERQHEKDSGHKTLVISLSVVLGVLALALLLGGFYFLYVYFHGRRPFSRRGATPIHDDEIASWRVSGTSEMGRERTAAASIIEKEPIPAIPDIPDVPDVPGPGATRTTRTMHHSGWTWSIQSGATGSPISPRSGFVSGYPIPDPNSPTFIARAPNSRTGLTDAAIPGEDPFIQPVKRQSSRLSKVASVHGRSKSRRSSMSAKSIRSIQSNAPPPSRSAGGHGTSSENRAPWFDGEEETNWRGLGNSVHTSNSNSPDSMVHGISGGLSPRPSYNPMRPGTGESGRRIA